MEKTKLGVSVGLLSMLCYFTGYQSLIACVVLFAVIMAFSDSATAKKNASQALLLSAFFDILIIIFGWISGKYLDSVSTISNWEWVRNLAKDVNVYEILSNFDLMGFLKRFLNFVEFILMVVFSMISLKGKNVKIPFVSKIVNKHFDNTEE